MRMMDNEIIKREYVYRIYYLFQEHFFRTIQIEYKIKRDNLKHGLRYVQELDLVIQKLRNRVQSA